MDLQVGSVSKFSVDDAGNVKANEVQAVSIFSMLERSSDPAKPADGETIIWMSDGTGLGDDGDVVIASTVGTTTNYAILFDHSAGTTWT